MIEAVLGILIPAGVANIMASLSRYIFPRWQTPVSARWFGDHKTWRGLVCGFLSVVILSFLFILPLFLFTSSGPMGGFDLWAFFASIFTSLLVGLGALAGDLVKSFFKRRLGIAPGQSWIPFDQIDWVLGALVANSMASVFLYRSKIVPLLFTDWPLWLIVIIIGGLLHPAFNALARLLRLQKNWL